MYLYIPVVYMHMLLTCSVKVLVCTILLLYFTTWGTVIDIPAYFHSTNKVIIRILYEYML